MPNDDQGIDPQTLKNIQTAQTLNGRPQTDFMVEYANIHDLVSKQTERAPEKAYLIYYNEETGEREEYSYKRFHEITNQVANFMINRLGLKRGDRVGTVMYNHAQSVFVYFAAMKLGACVCPVNADDDLEKIVFTFNNAEAKVVFARHDRMDKAKDALGQCPGVETLIQVGGEAAEGVLHLDTEVEKESGEFTPPDMPELLDDALIIYTSGTTGNPKGVVLSQYNLMIDPQSIAKWHKINTGTRMMCILPIHHVNGIVVTLFTPMYAGASVVLNRRFSARNFWKRIADDKVHIVSLVPTVLQFLSEANEDISAYDLDHFRHVICGAGTLSIGVGSRWEDTFGFRIMHGYGLSETTCYDCFLPVDLTDEEHRSYMRDFGYPSIGCPIESNVMDIQDENGNSLGPEKRGEIVIQGHLVMKYYYKRPDANKDTFIHGWFRSGDEGFYKVGTDERQYYFITGRLKELIIRGGINISPFEVEEAMMEVPGVNTALAIAFENDWYGEEVGGYVVLDEGAEVTEQQIIDHCMTKLPYNKCPKVIRFGTEIPVTSTGKFQRIKLKEMFREYEHVQYKDPSKKK